MVNIEVSAVSIEVSAVSIEVSAPSQIGVAQTSDAAREVRIVGTIVDWIRVDAGLSSWYNYLQQFSDSRFSASPILHISVCSLLSPKKEKK